MVSSQKCTFILLLIIKNSLLTLCNVPYNYFIFSNVTITLIKSLENSLSLRTIITDQGTYKNASGSGYANTNPNPERYVMQYSQDGSIWYQNSDSVFNRTDRNVTLNGLTPSTSYFIRVIGCRICNQTELDSYIEVTSIDSYGPYNTTMSQTDVDNSLKDCSSGSSSEERQDGVDLTVNSSRESVVLTVSYRQEEGNNYVHLQWTPGPGILPTHYLIYWVMYDNYRYYNCPKSQKSEQLNISSNHYSHELLVHPYANYSVKIEARNETTNFGTKCFSSRKGGSCGYFTTMKNRKIDQTAERPEVTVHKTDKDSVTLRVKLSCDKFTGPLYVKYQCLSSSSESLSRCNQIKYKEGQTSTQLPLANDYLVITGLTSNCTYKITLKLSRSPNWEENNFELEPVEATTSAEQRDSSIVICKVQKLEVTSKGPDHISLRLLVPEPSEVDLKEFRIKLTHGTMKTKLYFTRTLEKSKCQLWNRFYCVQDFPKVEANQEYHIKIFALNKNNLSGDEFDKEIAEADKKNCYANITLQTKEGVPEKPYDIRAFWISNATLNIVWHHPNQTNGKVRFFELKVELEYYESTNERHTQRIEKNSKKKEPVNNYVPEYSLRFPIPEYQAGQKLNNIKICIDTIIKEYRSNCKTKGLGIPPPGPPQLANLKFDRSVLLVPQPPNSPFVQEPPHVYAATQFDQSDLGRIFAHLEDTKRPDMPHGTIYERVLPLKDNHRNDSYLSYQHDMFKEKKRFFIAIFLVNEMNGKRNVSVTTVELDKHHQYEEPRSNALWVIPVLLLLIPALVYGIFRYRQSLAFKVQNALGHYSAADDFATLTLNTVQEGPKNDIYESVLDLTHSRRVKVNELASYVKAAIDSQDLQKQHELIPRAEILMTRNPNYTCTYASLPQNRPKNRYNNVLAFDHTLVKLPLLPGNEDPSCGYINANYIDGYCKKKAYIAAQGPLQHTLNDFWSMIWDNQVMNIVMMANLYDGPKKNCEQYWPNLDQELEFNGIKVRLISVTTCSTYHVREMQVRFGATTRSVTQVHFICWPSQGQPLYPQTLVPLVQKVLTLPYKGRSPILVHCSAGVGRTGTIILCDVCMRMAAAEGAVDFLGALTRLREQRPNMVDNAELYKLAHLVVLASLTAWNTSICCDYNLESAVERVLEEDLIASQMDYLLQNEWQDEAMKTVALGASKHVPIVPVKNRFPHILPDEICQVSLNLTPGEDSTSCYINAITVGGYNCPDKFIVTQHPLAGTMQDFWRLVAEQQSSFIVNINGCDDTEGFWPQADAPLELGHNLKVEHVITQVDKTLTVVEVRVVFQNSGFEKTRLTVQILNFTGWPRESNKPDNINDFLGYVMDSLSMAKKDWPVIVTCFDGATASGLFVSLSNILEELQRDRKCDICQIVRSIRICRKQFVCTEVQLELLYQALLVYARNFHQYVEPSF